MFATQPAGMRVSRTLFGDPKRGVRTDRPRSVLWRCGRSAGWIRGVNPRARQEVAQRCLAGHRRLCRPIRGRGMARRVSLARRDRDRGQCGPAARGGGLPRMSRADCQPRMRDRAEEQDDEHREGARAEQAAVIRASLRWRANRVERGIELREGIVHGRDTRFARSVRPFQEPTEPRLVRTVIGAALRRVVPRAIRSIPCRIATPLIAPPGRCAVAR